MQDHQQVIRRRKLREKDQRIQAILAAAKRVFFSKGYQKATMDEIAYEAEISKPTIYIYFKTKDILFASLMLPVLDEASNQLKNFVNKLNNGKYKRGSDLMHDLFAGFQQSYVVSPDSLRTIMAFFQQKDLVNQLDQETRNDFRSKGSHVFHNIRQVIEQAIRLGFLRPVDVYMMVDVLVGIFVGVTQIQDIKATRKGNSDTNLETTLLFAEKMIVDAFVIR